MTASMSKRDKIILLVLAVGALLFVPNYFFAYPLITETLERNKTVRELHDAESSYHMMVAMHPLREERYERMMAQIADGLPDTNVMFYSDRTHYEIIDLVWGCGLEITELSISPPSQSGLFGINAENGRRFPANAPEAERASFFVTIYETQMTIRISGGLENVLMAVDEINLFSEYTSVIAFSVQDLTANPISASITISAYMAIREDNAAVIRPAHLPPPDGDPLDTIGTPPLTRPSDTVQPTLSPDASYQSIYEDYTQKLRAAATALIAEFNAEAAENTAGLEGLSEINLNKINALAEISIEGIFLMAEYMVTVGGGNVAIYEQWVERLTNVYMEEIERIANVYMSLASS
jgi:hypothetical protein